MTVTSPHRAGWRGVYLEQRHHGGWVALSPTIGGSAPWHWSGSAPTGVGFHWVRAVGHTGRYTVYSPSVRLKVTPAATPVVHADPRTQVDTVPVVGGTATLVFDARAGDLTDFEVRPYILDSRPGAIELVVTGPGGVADCSMDSVQVNTAPNAMPNLRWGFPCQFAVTGTHTLVATFDPGVTQATITRTRPTVISPTLDGSPVRADVMRHVGFAIPMPPTGAMDLGVASLGTLNTDYDTWLTTSGVSGRPSGRVSLIWDSAGMPVPIPAGGRGAGAYLRLVPTSYPDASDTEVGTWDFYLSTPIAVPVGQVGGPPVVVDGPTRPGQSLVVSGPPTQHHTVAMTWTGPPASIAENITDDPALSLADYSWAYEVPGSSGFTGFNPAPFLIGRQSGWHHQITFDPPAARKVSVWLGALTSLPQPAAGAPVSINLSAPGAIVRLPVPPGHTVDITNPGPKDQTRVGIQYCRSTSFCVGRGGTLRNGTTQLAMPDGPSASLVFYSALARGGTVTVTVE